MQNPVFLVIVNGGNIAQFNGIGPNEKDTQWGGVSFHMGGPYNSTGCLTSPAFPKFRETLAPDLDAGNPVTIELQSFTPEDKPKK